MKLHKFSWFLSVLINIHCVLETENTLEELFLEAICLKTVFGFPNWGGRGVLLASGGQKTGMLLDTLQCISLSTMSNLVPLPCWYFYSIFSLPLSLVMALVEVIIISH